MANMTVRRQSRFDPMARDIDDMPDEDGYGDLGHKHPLRRVQEEDHKDGKSSHEQVSLPGIKSLFGVASDHSSTPSSSQLFQSPSLPSLIPNSPSSSPNSSRTSRYSSMASSNMPDNHAGWWAPEFQSGSPFQTAPHRANSFPSQPYVHEDHDAKRRRSDGPPAIRDAEESARLRWQAQSRNASFPSASPGPGYHSNNHGLRTLLHPPQATSAAISASMSRGSISGSNSGTPLSPTMENGMPPPRPGGSVSRNLSLVGGQLSRHFADLSAADRASASPSREMPPLPHVGPTERRPSMFPSLSSGDEGRLMAPPANTSRTPSPGSDNLRRQSLTRPSSPENGSRPELRRSSLTEIIMAKSGDSLTMTKGRFHAPPSEIASVAKEKPSFSEPMPAVNSRHSSAAWSRRESADSVRSSGIHDHDGHPQPPSRKRSAVGFGHAGDEDDDDTEMESDPAMRGMEVLVAAAAEEERKGRRSSEEDREGSPSKGGVAGGPKYTCAFCAKTFSRPSSLRIHTYSHTGERPYVCKEPTCRRRFSVQSNLKRHAKVHQLGAAGQQGASGHPVLGVDHGHPVHSLAHQQAHQLPPSMGHPGMSRGPHSHPGPGPMPPHGYHPGPPPPGYYPPPGYGGGHPNHHHGQPYPPYPDARYGAGPPLPGHGGMHHGPPPAAYRSASSSRRTSRDEAWSGGEGDGEEEGEDEEIDELDEDD
ncbi:hypothetical protein IAU60_004276 [Kwoniella sp. DSM 27419]